MQWQLDKKEMEMAIATATATAYINDSLGNHQFDDWIGIAYASTIHAKYAKYFEFTIVQTKERENYEVPTT